MNSIDTVFYYHNRSKHHREHYAASLGYMDWATQPNPFRSYSGSDYIELPLTFEHTTPPYHLIFQDDTIPKAPLHVKSISQLFQYSLGIALYKVAGVNRWALRCNASSGNLQPTEAYLIAPPIEGISKESTISHYTPKTHGLEILNSFSCEFWDDLAPGSFLVALSSIIWREAWKYGERAFRYTQLDAGHAMHAITISAKILGWHCKVLNNAKIQNLDTILGFTQKNRFHQNEDELRDMLLLITPEKIDKMPDISNLLKYCQKQYESISNPLSQKHHVWDILNSIDDATHQTPTQIETFHPNGNINKEASKESKEVVMKRRSAQVMDYSQSKITQIQFVTLLESIAHDKSSVHLAIFIHNIENIESGLYMYLRNKEHLELLKVVCDAEFLWKENGQNLFLLKLGDYRVAAKAISCSQDIAADKAFSLGMLSHFKTPIQEYGAQHYKELYWECGAIGQQLYLEATSLNLSATGIGCFLDDDMHKILGLSDDSFQSLYHFTVGRAIVDVRLQNDPAYVR